MIFLPLESLRIKISKMEQIDLESVSFWKSSIVCNIKTEVSNFYPKKIFHYPCLLGIVVECWQEGLRSYDQIYEKISNSNLFSGSYSIIGCRVDKKKSCLFLCHMHLSQMLMGIYVHDTCVEKEENQQFYFKYLKLKLFKSCVLHFMRQNFSIYAFLKMN